MEIHLTSDPRRPELVLEISEDVESLAFSADGYLLAMSTVSGEVILENPSTGREVFTLHSSEKIRQIGFSENNMLMAICADEERLFILDLQCPYSSICTPEKRLCGRLKDKARAAKG